MAWRAASSVCMIFGALKEDFKTVSAVVSWQQAESSDGSVEVSVVERGPSVSGAPKRVAFFFDVIRKSRKVGSVVVGQR